MRKPHVVGVSASVITYNAFGALWYSDLMCGPMWLIAQGKVPEEVNPAFTPLLLSIVSSVAISLVLDQLLQKSLTPTIWVGVKLGVAVGFSTTALPIVTHYGFLEISWTVGAIDALKEVFAAALIGAVLCVAYSKRNIG